MPIYSNPEGSPARHGAWSIALAAVPANGATKQYTAVAWSNRPAQLILGSIMSEDEYSKQLHDAMGLTDAEIQEREEIGRALEESRKLAIVYGNAHEEG